MIKLNKFTPHLLAAEVPEDATKFKIGQFLTYFYIGFYIGDQPANIKLPITEGKLELVGLLSDCLKGESLAEKCIYIKKSIGRISNIELFKTRLESESLDLSKNYLIIKVL